MAVPDARTAAAREDARRGDGKFGPQDRLEASVDLQADASSVKGRVAGAVIRHLGYAAMPTVADLNDPSIDYLADGATVQAAIEALTPTKHHERQGERAEFVAHAVAVMVESGHELDRGHVAAQLYAYDHLDDEFAYANDAVRQRYLAVADVAVDVAQE